MLLLVGRLVCSLAAGLCLFALVPVLGLMGAPTSVLKTLVVPGELLASMAARVVPRQWIYGDPYGEVHVPDISAGGFVLLCTVLAWTVIVLLCWELLRFRHRRKQGPQV